MTIEAVVRVIKDAMKAWKESNMNMIKESINTYLSCLEHCPKMPKKALVIYAPFLAEKIGDSKYQPLIFKLLDGSSEFMTAKFVSTQIIKQGIQSKVPKNNEQLANWLTLTIDEWGSAGMPLKETIDCGVKFAGSSNGPVRVAALKMFGMLYKHMGDTIKNFLGEIKESTTKVLEEEFKKITPLKKGEFKSNKVIKGLDAEEAKALEKAQAAGDDGLPRENISKALTSKLLAGFKGEKPDERQKTVQEI